MNDDGIIDFIDFVERELKKDDFGVTTTFSTRKRAVDFIAKNPDLDEEEFLWMVSTAFMNKTSVPDFTSFLKESYSRWIKSKQERKVNLEMEEKPVVEPLTLSSEDFHGGEEVTMSMKDSEGRSLEQRQMREEQENIEKKEGGGKEPEFKEELKKKVREMIESHTSSKAMKKVDELQEVISKKVLEKEMEKYSRRDLEEIKEGYEAHKEWYREELGYHSFDEYFRRRHVDREYEEELTKEFTREHLDPLLSKRLDALLRITTKSESDFGEETDTIDLDATLENAMDTLGAIVEVEYEKREEVKPSVALFIDTSGSVQDYFDDIRKVVEKVNKQVDVYGFNDHLYRISRPSDVKVGWTDFAESFKDACNLGDRYKQVLIISDFSHYPYRYLIQDELKYYNKCVLPLADDVVWNISFGDEAGNEGFREDLVYHEDKKVRAVSRSSFLMALVEALLLIGKQ